MTYAACDNTGSFNPLSEARDQTRILVDTSQVLNLLSHNRNSQKYLFWVVWFCLFGWLVGIELHEVFVHFGDESLVSHFICKFFLPICGLSFHPPSYFSLYKCDSFRDLIWVDPFNICPFVTWLISLGIMPSGIIPAAAGVRISFLFKAEWYSFVWTDSILFIHPFIDGHSGCFYC